MNDKRSIYFITGLSGAGISTALKVFEDCGFEVFDNCPLTHVESIIAEAGFEDRPLAFGLDTRARAFDPDKVVEMSRHNGARIIFLKATNKALQKRFSETRRKHPLARDRAVLDGIIYEREWLTSLNDRADQQIDTTDMSIHDLKRLLEANLGVEGRDKRLSVTVMSFGFKYGVPREVDLVFDVRFLANPHWEESLRSLTGKDQAVQDYIEGDENYAPFYQKLTDLIDFLLPNYTAEGKSYLTIAFGCTGGQHRSVYLTERLADHIEKMDYPVTRKHRQLD